MEDMKIKHFAKSHPDAAFPEFRSLSMDECASLKSALAKKLGLPSKTSGLEVLQSLERLAKDVPNFRPSDDTFSPMPLLVRVQSDNEVYINWDRFEKIDQMEVHEFASAFHDLWYPSSDDIEVFDSSLRWVLLIRHFDAIQMTQFKR